MVGIADLTYNRELDVPWFIYFNGMTSTIFFLSTINGPADCEIQKRKNRPFGGVNINIPANKI